MIQTTPPISEASPRYHDEAGVVSLAAEWGLSVVVVAASSPRDVLPVVRKVGVSCLEAPTCSFPNVTEHEMSKVFRSIVAAEPCIYAFLW